MTVPMASVEQAKAVGRYDARELVVRVAQPDGQVEHLRVRSLGVLLTTIVASEREPVDAATWTAVSAAVAAYARSQTRRVSRVAALPLQGAA